MDIYIQWHRGEFANRATLTDDNNYTVLIYPENEVDDIDGGWWVAEWDTDSAAALGLDEPILGTSDQIPQLAGWMAFDLGAVQGFRLLDA